jgi:tripartite-type tricarboxylate transporter receptor subunit TctC
MASHIRRRTFLAALGGAAAWPLAASIGSVAAQPYPSRPITMIVPFPAGGPTDTIGRLIAERMRITLGQPVIVENVSGGGGRIGVGRVARSPGDGYTLIIGHWSTHVVSAATSSLPYDVVNDFEPISLITDGPQLLISKKTIAARDSTELIAWLKANPGKALVGIVGIGGAGHLAALMFQKTADVHVQFIPYRGAAPRTQDLLAGQIDLAFDQAANALPHVRSGSLRAFMVTAKTRLKVAPDIPTVDEVGLSGFYTSFWHALWLPKGTPKDVTEKLNAAVVHTLAESNVRQRLADLGQEIPPREQQTPEALAAHQRSEIDKWWPIIKAAGIKVD